MAKARAGTQTETFIRATGITAKSTAMECSSWPGVTSMTANGLTEKEAAKVSSILLTKTTD